MMELCHAAVMEVASPIFFLKFRAQRCRPQLVRVDLVLHTEALFLCGARDQRKPLFCYTHASHPCYGCNRMTVRYFEMPLATRKPRCSPSHWFGELKPDTNYNSVASCSSCHLVEDTLRVRKISMNDYHSLYNFTCLRLRHQFSRR